MNTKNTKQKVFGLGLSRTGTTSLTHALRFLGYSAVHFPLGILKYHRGLLELNHKRVAQFDALTDTPVARMYKELDHSFPNSKFILTTRDIESWARSMQRLNLSYRSLRFNPKINQLTKDLYGVHSFYESKKLQERFAKHEEEVRTYFKDRIGSDLLVFNVTAGDGWDTLCNFLGHPVPKNTPFPRYNQGHSTTFENIIDFFRYG